MTLTKSEPEGYDLVMLRKCCAEKIMTMLYINFENKIIQLR